MFVIENIMYKLPFECDLLLGNCLTALMFYFIVTQYNNISILLVISLLFKMYIIIFVLLDSIFCVYFMRN